MPPRMVAHGQLQGHHALRGRFGPHDLGEIELFDDRARLASLKQGLSRVLLSPKKRVDLGIVFGRLRRS